MVESVAASRYKATKMVEVVWQESSKPNGVGQVSVIIAAVVMLRSKLWRFSVALE